MSTFALAAHKSNKSASIAQVSLVGLELQFKCVHYVPRWEALAAFLSPVVYNS